jgi:hypothetical protein
MNLIDETPQAIGVYKVKAKEISSSSYVIQNHNRWYSQAELIYCNSMEPGFDA